MSYSFRNFGFSGPQNLGALFHKKVVPLARACTCDHNYNMT